MSLEYDYDEEGSSDFSFEDESDVEVLLEQDDLIVSNNEAEQAETYTTIRTKNVTYNQWLLEAFIYKNFVSPAYNLKALLLPQCSLDDLLIMLHHFKWQPEDVVLNYFDAYEKTVKDCGISKQTIFDTKEDFYCVICCDDYASADTFSLECGHEYCSSCYSEYIHSEIVHGRLIRCMDPSCDFTIPHKCVQELYEYKVAPVEAPIALTTASSKDDSSDDSDSSILVQQNEQIDPSKEAYHKILFRPKLIYTDAILKEPLNFNVLLKAAARRFFSVKSIFKWCPAPDCESVVEVISKTTDADTELNILDTPIVACSYDHEFCFDCQYENHLPCPCAMVKLWIKKCQDDSETARWIEVNTNACPKCAKPIEKNGGCNHMTCASCKFEFCWLCSQDWHIHGTQYYSCSKFNPDVKKEVENKHKENRESLQRYLHYYKRFSLHESSMKGDLVTLLLVNQKMKVFMDEQVKTNSNHMSWIDVQFLQDSFKALTSGRKTLKWAYCFVFYLKSTHYASVFEQMQEYLNKSVEDLSKIFEELINKKNTNVASNLILKHRQNVIHLSSLITKRQQSLIDCAASGIKEGLLQFMER